MKAASTQGIWDLSIAATPVAVLDFETTGLCAGSDRVVEISVVRCEPNEHPRMTFETLIHPERPMGASFVHGISDSDVAEAPKFRDVAGSFVESLAGCVVAAYNVGFDMTFLRDELRRVGLKLLPPHLCLMYLRPLLGFGRHSNLAAACRAHRISYQPKHTAASDTMAAAGLWQCFRQIMMDREIGTFRELAAIRSYQFTRSFRDATFTDQCAEGLGRAPLKPRTKIDSKISYEASQ